MKRSWWKTGPSMKHTQSVLRPSSGQLLRQLALLGLILLIWGGLLMLFSSATGTPSLASVAAVDAPTQTPPAPTSVPPTAPTNTPLATAPAVASTLTAPVATSTQVATPTTASNPTAPAATVTRAATSTSAAATPTNQAAPVETPVATATAPAAEPTAGSSFSGAVLPIFKQVCGKCHGGDKVEEGLNLLSHADVMRGSDNGPIVVPGDAANSLLAQQVESGEMPKRGPRLLPKQIQAIVEWINAGAPNN
ncbi:MAG: hypothetical protein HGB05_16665 [Chloroflexi bacterium]|nr:hypothetical protein [Chloroflexota bacterium]